MGNDRMNGSDSLKKRAICVCSGGLDSTISAAIAKKGGYDLYFLHLNYGHRAEKKEIEATKNIAKILCAKETKIVDLDFIKELGSSSLTDFSIPVPVGDEVGFGTKTPSTWVPCRNMVFLSLASSFAEAKSAEAIFVGFNAEEAESYPDNTFEFVEKFNNLLVGSVASFSKPPKIMAPLVDMYKKDIVKKGIEVDAPISLTWSCYLDYEKQCGECEACQHRRRGFKEANIEDPTEYMKG